MARTIFPMRGCWLALVSVVALAVVATGCGGTKKATTTQPASATPTVSEATKAGAPPACTSYGATWLKAYNKTALRQGSPIRMVSACCGPVTKGGRHHCFLKVTLVGTKQLGCETVDLGPDGTPATVGRHENCALHK
jgi:hypothetical protein